MENAPYRGSKIEHIVSRILERVVTLFFFVILVVTILLVILRYVFNASIIGGNELIEYLFIYTTAIGAVVAIGKREHIRINFFVDKLKQPWKASAETLSRILIAFINVVIFSLSFTWIRKVGYSESPVMRIPMWTVQVSVPIGCALAVLYCFYDAYKVIIDGIRETRKGEKA